MTTDTSAEAVERLAAVFDHIFGTTEGDNGTNYGGVAATLRALPDPAP